MVFLPQHDSMKPALVLELKWDKTAEGAINPIKKKKYVSALKEYRGDILLVGINYEKKSRKHRCKIENFVTAIDTSEYYCLPEPVREREPGGDRGSGDCGYGGEYGGGGGVL